MNGRKEVRAGSALFVPQPGDLFFQELGEYVSTGSTPPLALLGRGRRVVEHVGMLASDANGQPGLIEAFPPRVQWLPLNVFLGRHRDHRGRPSVFVARLEEPLRHLVPAALAFVRSRIGRPLDEWYDEGDDAYYCSELIVAAFAHASGADAPVFQRAQMTFTDPDTDQVAPYWKRHFSRAAKPSPQGVPGSNPGRLSKAACLRVVHAYGQLTALPKHIAPGTAQVPMPVGSRT